MTGSNIHTTQTALRRRLEQRVLSYTDRHSLWPESGVLLLAVSGGQDSSALFSIFERLIRPRAGSLAVAYFDHGLRGKKISGREQEFVAGLCAEKDVPFVSGYGDVLGRAKKEHLSLEDAARRERYEFLGRVARELGAAHVATGHTSSDLAETVLLNITRGAGLDGLVGMRPKADWPLARERNADLVLVRPLLSLSRKETLAYCAASNLEPVADESNVSPEFRRNRVRNEVLPLLESFNPSIERALLGLAESVGEDQKFLNEIAAEGVEGGPGKASISRRWFEAAAPSIRSRAARAAVRAAVGDLTDFTSRHIQSIERLVLKGQTGDMLDLPAHVTATLSRSTLILQRVERPSPILPDSEVSLAVPGNVEFGWLRIVASASRAAASVNSVEVDSEAVCSGLVVRRRREGDRFQPTGMVHTKKLHDFFIDSHVARAERDMIPLFVSRRGIAWVGGLRIAEWAKPREGNPTTILSFGPAG